MGSEMCIRDSRATVLCAGFEDVAECKQLDLLSAFPEGDADVPRNTACRGMEFPALWSGLILFMYWVRSLMD